MKSVKNIKKFEDLFNSFLALVGFGDEFDTFVIKMDALQGGN